MTESPVPPSRSTKTCPFCQMTDVPAAATRCPHCAGDIGKHEMLNSKVCFVATATMGDLNHPDVETLRQFRDKILRPTFGGPLVIRAYYRVGPWLASVIQKSNKLKTTARSFVVVPLAKYARRKLGA